MPDPRLQKLADVIVNYSTRVQPGDIVRLGIPTPALPLGDELLIAVLKAGGHPLLRVTSPRMSELFMAHATAEQIAFQNPIDAHEHEKIDVRIGVWAEENTKAMSNVPREKMQARSQANKPIMELVLGRAAKGELRWCGTQYPTSAHAQDAEMSLDDYAEFVFKAGKLHLPDPIAAWTIQRDKQQRLIDQLQGKTTYHVKAANGTDVTMDLTGKTWVNCYGDCNFPDGEVFTGPTIDSVNGVIAFSFPAVYGGNECDGVRLTFKDGKVVDASADKGEAFLLAMLDQDPGARFMGECAIGTNYDITRYTKNTLFDEKIGGTVHFALGKGYPETGNTNDSGLHWDMVVDLRPGGTVEIDGDVVSRDGKFAKVDL